MKKTLIYRISLETRNPNLFPGLVSIPDVYVLQAPLIHLREHSTISPGLSTSHTRLTNGEHQVKKTLIYRISLETRNPNLFPGFLSIPGVYVLQAPL